MTPEPVPCKHCDDRIAIGRPLRCKRNCDTYQCDCDRYEECRFGTGEDS